MITLQEMYFALVNSVATTLTGAVGASDTTLYVLDDSRIPDPPNLLVLGENSALAETVKLVEKDGTKLTVVRGFQGSARAWSEGATIARNFTAHDADTFKKNIETLADGHNALFGKHNALKTDHEKLSDDVGELKTSHDKLSGTVNDHENAEMPHKLKVRTEESEQIYKYGFRIDEDGTLVFIYEQAEGE